MISFAVSESDGSTSRPALGFSGIVHSSSSLALVLCTNYDIELRSFADVATDEKIESEIT